MKLGLIIVLLPLPVIAEQFETWQEAQTQGYTAPLSESTVGGQAPVPVPSTVPQVPTAEAAGGQAPLGEEGQPPMVRFGAGAIYLVSIRPHDFATGDTILSEFSIGLSPFRAIFEIGADFSLARDNRFFVRPNLKLLLINRLSMSLYLEGQLALFSHPGGLEVGYGGGLGGSVGILDNLALEVFCAAMFFSLSVQDASSLVGLGVLGNPPEENSLVVLPYAGARLVARF